jgi:D-alanyl-D-alanine carboxypeptidase (penicillin-binding protein 5/6)
MVVAPVCAVCVAAVLAAVPFASAAAPPRLAVRAAAVIEESTGRRLLGVNADASVPIASATKIMTALLVLEHARLAQDVTMPAVFFSSVDSQLGLAPGERMSVRDLLLAMLLPSADDAAYDLAYNVGGRSVARFVAMMNARAARLGLTHTHYTTPVGLDTAGNFSSASDLVRLAGFVLTHEPWFARAVALRGAVLRSGPVRFVVNRDALLSVPWVHGVKTGHTLGAGYVLVSSGTQRGMTLVSAVLGTDSIAARDANALAALDYGFANFSLMPVLRSASVVARPLVSGVSGLRALVVAGGTVSAVIARGDRVSLRLSWSRARPFVGPLRRGAVVGSAAVVAGGAVVGRVPLVLAAAVPAPSSSAAGALALLLLLALAAAVGFWLVRRRQLELAARRRERVRMRGRRARALADELDALGEGSDPDPVSASVSVSVSASASAEVARP